MLINGLAQIDQYLQTLIGAQFTIGFWGVLSGVLSMACYRMLLRKTLVQELQQQLKQQRDILLKHEGEFADLLAHVRSTMILNLRVLVFSGVPAFCGLALVLPIAFMLEDSYGGRVLFQLGPDWLRAWWFSYSLWTFMSAWLCKIYWKI